MAQNWNNLLTYIKRELGAPVNAIEMTDAEMQQQITDLVMPDFSQYEGENRLYLLTPDMKTIVPGSKDTFRLPIVATGTEVTRVNQAYYDTATGGVNAAINASSGVVSNPFQLIPSTVFNSANAYLQPIKSYIFNKPDIIIFNEPVLSTIILDLDVVHTNPNTIPGDLYTKVFKKQCAISIIDYIIAIRSKFDNVQTPLGEVGMNIDFLISKADRFREEVKEVLDDLPPDPLVEFII